MWRWAGEQNGQSDIGCVCNLAPHLPVLSTGGGSGSESDKLQLAAGSGRKVTHTNTYCAHMADVRWREIMSQTEKKKLSEEWNNSNT